MDLFNKISDLVDQEKKRRAEIEKIKLEKERQNKLLFAKQKQAEENNKKYNSFLNTFKYGTIQQNDGHFKNAGVLSFEDCLQKAYCNDISEKDIVKGICTDKDHREYYPYIGWTSNTADKGYCLLGNEENDIRTLNYNGEDAASVYVTPIKNQEEHISDNLSKRENAGKIKLINRIKDDLETTTRKLLHEKDKANLKSDENIEDNYQALSGLDNRILTMTQEIRQNTGKYILSDRVSSILQTTVIVITLILFIMLTYYTVKYANNMRN